MDPVPARFPLGAQGSRRSWRPWVPSQDTLRGKVGGGGGIKVLWLMNKLMWLVSWFVVFYLDKNFHIINRMTEYIRSIRTFYYLISKTCILYFCMCVYPHWKFIFKPWLKLRLLYILLVAVPWWRRCCSPGNLPSSRSRTPSHHHSPRQTQGWWRRKLRRRKGRCLAEGTGSRACRFCNGRRLPLVPTQGPAVGCRPAGDERKKDTEN